MVRCGGGLQCDGSRLARALPRGPVQLLQPAFQPQDGAHAGGPGIYAVNHEARFSVSVLVLLWISSPKPNIEKQIDCLHFALARQTLLTPPVYRIASRTHEMSEAVAEPVGVRAHKELHPSRREAG